MRSSLLKIGSGLLLAILALIIWQNRSVEPPSWNEAEIAVLRSLVIDGLSDLPPDFSNAVADDARAAEFGERLFSDARLSDNNGISCATCHQRIRNFTDGLPRGQAIGTSKRNTPSITGTAYSPWLYWDGRKDSQWSQALSPLEDPNEHGSNRMQIVRVIANDALYKETYLSLFGALPDVDDTRRFPTAAGPGLRPEWDAAWSSMAEPDRDAVNRVFANIGKAIAAFERTLVPGGTRFDDYVRAVLSDDSRQAELFTDDEVHGLRLFIGEGNCLQCHNGPLLTNNEFHNTGVISAPGEVPDKGRVAGVQQVLDDPFNCLGDYSDDAERRCAELQFARSGPELIGAFRTPSLRSLQNTAPFMHKGQMPTIAEVLKHYNIAPDAMIGHNEAKPLGFSRRQLRQLEAFLATLSTQPQS